MEIAIILVSMVLIYHILKYDRLFDLLITSNEHIVKNINLIKREQELIKGHLLITELVMGHTIYTIVKNYIDTQVEVSEDRSALNIQLEEIVQRYNIDRKTAL